MCVCVNVKPFLFFFAGLPKGCVSLSVCQKMPRRFVYNYKNIFTLNTVYVASVYDDVFFLQVYIFCQG